MLKQLSCAFLFLASFTACQQDADDVQPVSSAKALNPDTAFLSTVQSSTPALGDNYISGEFDGNPLYFVADRGLSQTSFYHIEATQNVDYCYLITQNPGSDIELSLSFLNTQLFQKTLPASWPHPNPAYCEQATVALTQVGPKYKIPSVFRGGTGYSSPLKVQVTSVANEIVEGTFEGTLFQYVNGKYAGSSFDVKNGKFRVKVHKQTP
jgi:hypothetical protein